MLRSLILFLLCASATLAQSNTGELRLKARDASGAAVLGSITLVSESSQFRDTYSTDASGNAIAKQLPFGLYSLHIARDGFPPTEGCVAVTRPDLEDLLSRTLPGDAVEIRA